MASLTLQIGPLSSAVNAANAKASVAVNNVILKHGYDPAVHGETDQNKADFFMQVLKNWISRQSAQYQAKLDSNAAFDAAQADEANKFDP